MKVVIRIDGISGTDRRAVCPTYVATDVLDGAISLVTDVAKAKRYESARDALDAYNAVSPAIPVRPDGEPNRPMTAFDVEMIPERWL